MGHTPYLPPHLHIYRGAAAHLGGVLDTPSGFLFPSLFRCLMLLPSFFHLELIPSLCFRLQDVGSESSIMNKHGSHTFYTLLFKYEAEVLFVQNLCILNLSTSCEVDRVSISSSM